MKKSSYLCNICGCDVETRAGWGIRPDQACFHICKDCILALGKVAEVMTRGISPVHPPCQRGPGAPYRFSIGQTVRDGRTGLIGKILAYNKLSQGYSYKLSGSQGWYREDELTETMDES